MIKIIQNKSVLDYDIKDNSVILINNNTYKYKEKYIGMNVLVLNKTSFMQKYSTKKQASKNVKFILMNNAYTNVKDKLLIYGDINDLSFVNNLLLTYTFYKENTVIDNDKYHDLKHIFDEYEDLLHKNDFSTEYDLYDFDVDKIEYENIYFENINKLNKYDINLINRLKEKKNVTVLANTINNYSLINDLNKICNIEYEEVKNYHVNNLFKIASKDLFNNTKIVSCNDLYEEVKYILNDIKININKGLEYKDILVISPDIKRYESYFNLLFDIPYENNINSGFLTKNFFTILKTILDGDFSSINFVNILKLDLFDIKKEDINLVDNYIYELNLENENFYIIHDSNYFSQMKIRQKDKYMLNKINDIKLNMITPFKYLMENIKGVSDKKELLKYLFMFLDELKITDKLCEKDYDGYNLLISILEDLNDYMINDTSITDILSYIINLCDLKENISKMKDEINICSLDEYCNNNYKLVYFIGLTEKDIPKKFSFNTLFNNGDIDDINLFNLIKASNDINNNLISNVLLNENVIITYHKLTDENKKLEKSPLLNKFKNKEVNYKYVIDKKSNIILDKKIDSDLALKLYGNTLNLSPSSLEVLAKCKYSFFLNYGLKLKIKEKLVFDNRMVGTFVHYILENAIKDKISYDEIKEKVDCYTDNFLKENNYIISDITMYVINELKISTCILLEVIFDELKSTKLIPEKEELSLKDKPLKITLSKGVLNVSGIVDRLDSYIEDNNYYFRIIDYKTGSKKFRLDDVLIGLNMQMLIYLTLIKENNINAIPTGFLYFPALVHYNKEKVNTSLNESLANIKKDIKMNGIINKDYLNLYDDKIGYYIDVTTRDKLNDEKVFSSDELSTISEKIKEILVKQGNDILDGDIRINPIKDAKNDSCKYCMFNGICKFNEKENKVRRYKNLKNKEALSKIEEELRK